MASITELWSKSQSVYRTLEETDMSWLLWLLVISLVNVLGGLAALGPLFNLNSEQLRPNFNVAGGDSPEYDEELPLCKYMQSAIHREEKKLCCIGVTYSGVGFTCDNIKQPLPCLAALPGFNRDC